jgi:Tol biopolymer transport system component
MFKLLLGVALALCVQASTIDEVLKQLEAVKSFSGVSISPNGRWLTWVRALPDGNSEIYLLERKNSAAKPERITSGDPAFGRREHSVVWAPDSKQFAFLCDADKIFLADASSGKVRQLADLKGYATDVRWRPDGSQIAFLYAANGGGGGPLEAVPAQTGVIGGETHNQRLTTLNLSGGAPVSLSPAELNVYEYDWSPDGMKFAAIAAPGPADNNWWTAKLYTLDVRSKEMTVVYQPPVDRQITVPRWSPDGKTIAFIGGLMSDEDSSAAIFSRWPAAGCAISLRG